MNNAELNEQIRNQLHLTLNFPVELRDEKRFVCYKAQFNKEKEGKIDKIPTDPLTPTPKSINHLDPVNWVTFDEAYNNIERSRHLAGISYILTEEDDIYCIDFDQCLDIDGTVIDKDIKEILNLLSTYTEISISRTGLHCFGKGSLIAATRNRYKLCEIYSNKRFIAITGNIFSEYPITEDQESLDELINIIERKQMNNTKQQVQEKQIPSILQNIQKSEPSSIQDQLSSANTNEQKVESTVEMTPEFQELEDDFTRMGTKERETETWSNRAYVLFTRGWHPLLRSQYPSQSEADWSLCTFLAWLTDCDKEAMEAIFNNSELGKRDKWRFNKTYRDICIKEAINTNQTYIKQGDRKNWPSLKEEQNRTRNNRNSIEDILRDCGFQSSIDNRQNVPEMNAIIYSDLPCPSGNIEHKGQIAYFYATATVKNPPKSFFKCLNEDCSYHKTHDIYTYVDFLEENYNA